MKKMLILALAVLMIAVLPCAAFALNSEFPSPTEYTPTAGSQLRAKSYAIQFETDKGIGDNDTWEVYTAPSLYAVRGANGKAMTHTSEKVHVGGWDGAWLLVRYEKNNGGYRVGWVPQSTIGTRLESRQSVKFAYWTVTLDKNCTLTDDPLLESEALDWAAAGEKLTYLGYYCYNNGREYAYVMGNRNDQPICGFIPFDAIAW